VTTPAHSSLPDKRDEDLSPQGGAAVNTKPRSKRIYVLWATALTLLITLGLVCWLVVPLWQVHGVLQKLGASSNWRRARPSWKESVGEDAIQRLGGPAKAAPRLVMYMRSWLGKGEYGEGTVAAGLLGDCGDAALPFLTEECEREEWSEFASWHLVCTLRQDPKRLLGFLTHENADVRRAAAVSCDPPQTHRLRAFVQNDPDAFELMLRAARCKDETSRCAATFLLVHSRKPKAVETLSQIALGDSAPRVRRFAASALEKIKAEQEKKK